MPEGGKNTLFFCVVEDDSAVADLVRQVLENAGHRVQAFLSSREAATAIPNLCPDVVITDIMIRPGAMYCI